MRNPFAVVGRYAAQFMSAYGRVTILTIESLAAWRRIPKYLPQILEQYVNLERRSRPVATVTAAAMGLILGVQIGTQINAATPAWIEGGLILRAVLLEMGPLILSLILAGRIGAGIASELGAMQVTEQIDALRAMAIDPVEFLVMPRVVAALVAFPVLIIYSDLIAILAVFVSSHFTIHLTWVGFVKGMRHSFVVTDVFASIIKAVVFGEVIVIVGSYFGLSSRRGAKGVGAATTQAFVWTAIAILFLDYIISAVLYFIW